MQTQFLGVYSVCAVIVLEGKLKRKKDQFLVRPDSKSNSGQGPTQQGLKKEEEEVLC